MRCRRTFLLPRSTSAHSGQLLKKFTPEKKLKMQITLLEHRRLPRLQNELLLHITTAVLSLKVHSFIEN